MHESRVANLLGAAALAINDQVVGSVTGRARLSPSAVAAVVVLRELGPMGVSRLGECVGVTQSAATRLVDALERAGLSRRAAPTHRERLVELTPAGSDVAQGVLDERDRRLTELIARLDGDEITALEHALTKLLRGLYGFVPNSALLCRYCDRQACTTGAVCPVGQAERDQQQVPP